MPRIRPRSPATRRAPRRSAAGTSLVEAMVSFLVLALGMVAVGRTQWQQRIGVELARQRSEAVLLAQQQIEIARGTRFDALANGSASIDAAPGTTMTRQVDATGLLNEKAVAVTVRWTDRSGKAQRVTLSTLLDGTDPVLTGALALAAASPTASTPASRTP